MAVATGASTVSFDEPHVFYVERTPQAPMSTNNGSALRGPRRVQLSRGRSPGRVRRITADILGDNLAMQGVGFQIAEGPNERTVKAAMATEPLPSGRLQRTLNCLWHVAGYNLLHAFHGLRRQEIASPTLRSFELDFDLPIVTGEAVCSKGGVSSVDASRCDHRSVYNLGLAWIISTFALARVT
jgi:hypothetical protein